MGYMTSWISASAGRGRDGDGDGPFVAVLERTLLYMEGERRGIGSINGDWGVLVECEPVHRGTWVQMSSLSSGRCGSWMPCESGKAFAASVDMAEWWRNVSVV